MTLRFGKIGRSKIPKPLLSMGLLLLMGYTFELGGCGGSRERFAPAVPIQADGHMPEDIARQIRACAAEHRVHLGFMEHNIAFDITFADNAEVDEITLLGSTLRDEGLEACLASALRSLSGDDLPMRRADEGFPGAVAPESRAVLGQEEVLILACLNNPPCLLSLTLLVGAHLHHPAALRSQHKNAPIARTCAAGGAARARSSQAGAGARRQIEDHGPTSAAAAPAAAPAFQGDLRGEKTGTYSL